jgi:hypothetical protein
VSTLQTGRTVRPADDIVGSMWVREVYTVFETSLERDEESVSVDVLTEGFAP